MAELSRCAAEPAAVVERGARAPTDAGFPLSKVSFHRLIGTQSQSLCAWSIAWLFGMESLE
jgi:hypothetical protein